MLREVLNLKDEFIDSFLIILYVGHSFDITVHKIKGSLAVTESNVLYTTNNNSYCDFIIIFFLHFSFIMRTGT